MGIPARVIQLRNETCWAACMECWTREAYYYPYIAYQEGLANQYGSNAQGGLDSKGSKIIDFCNEFWLSRKVFPAGQLTSDHIERWLEIPGYFMYVTQTAANASHAVLVYSYYDGVLYGMNSDPSTPYPYKRGLANLPAVMVFYLDHKKIL